MIKVYTSDKLCLDVIVPADSQAIFPVGWAETNEYPVTTPILNRIAPPPSFSSIKDGKSLIEVILTSISYMIQFINPLHIN